MVEPILFLSVLPSVPLDASGSTQLIFLLSGSSYSNRPRTARCRFAGRFGAPDRREGWRCQQPICALPLRAVQLP
ncbi:MAG: hypothetical protein K2W91_00935 [Novosphingobium sp.]|nr:hypothetical protein [Novosphingobium sp.]